MNAQLAPRNKDILPDLMREWAQYWESVQGVGYPGATPVWYAVYSPVRGEFGSCLPRGVDKVRLRGIMRRLVDAMDALMADPDAREPVGVTQVFYVLGPAAVAQASGKGMSWVYSTAKTGEALIKREMKLRS